MAARDRRRRRVLRDLGPSSSSCSAGGRFASYQFDLGARWFGTGTTTPPTGPGTEPAAVPAAGRSDPARAGDARAGRPAVATADDGEMAPRKVARVLTPLLADADLGTHVVADVADLSSGDVVFQQGRDGRAGLHDQAAHDHGRAARARPGATGSPPASCSREPAGDSGSCWSGAATRYLASKPATPDEAAYPARADLAPCRGRPPRPWRPGGCAGSGWGTTTRCSPVPPPARSGRPATSPTAWSRRSAPSGSTRVGRPTARAAWRTPRSPRRRTSPRTCARPAWSVSRCTGAAPGERRRDAHRPGPAARRSPQIVEHMLEVSDNEAAEVLGHQVGVATRGPGRRSPVASRACARP